MTANGGEVVGPIDRAGKIIHVFRQQCERPGCAEEARYITESGMFCRVPHSPVREDGNRAKRGPIVDHRIDELASIANSVQSAFPEAAAALRQIANSLEGKP